jgi:hypothetical protein
MSPAMKAAQDAELAIQSRRRVGAVDVLLHRRASFGVCRLLMR